MSRKNIITFAIVGLLGIVLGAFLLLNNNPGTVAEIVEVTTADVSTASVRMCTVPGQGLRDANGVEDFVAQVNARTEILDQRQRSPANLRAVDIEVGQRVRVWTDGVLMESAPPQVKATRIIVLQNGKAGESLCGQ